MAILTGDITLLDEYVSAVNLSAYTTTSISFTADKLCILAIAYKIVTGSAAAPLTVTTSGLTWVLHNTQINSGIGVSFYRCTPTSGTSGGTTITFVAAQTDIAAKFIEVDNADVSGTNGENSIIQQAGGGDSGTSITTSLSSSIGSGNLVISAVSAVNNQDFWTAGVNETALGDTTFTRDFVQYNLLLDKDSDLTNSDISSKSQVVIEIAASGAVPAISSPTATSISTTTLSGTVSTDTASGTLYWYVSQSGSAPSATDLKAGTGADASSSQNVTSTGTQPLPFMSGLVAGTTYYVHYLHNDSGDSNIVSTGAVVTASLYAQVTVPDGTNLSGLSYIVLVGHDLAAATITHIGTGQNTDSSGEISINVTGSSLSESDPFMLVFGDWTTTPTTASIASVCFGNVIAE